MKPEDKQKIEELLPCPFCGGKADRFRVNGHLDEVRHVVECNTEDCFLYARSSINTQPTVKEATRAWNTRAQNTCQAEEIVALTNFNEQRIEQISKQVEVIEIMTEALEDIHKADAAIAKAKEITDGK